MTAPDVLAAIEARGGSLSVARDATGAAMLKITPRGIVPDLLPDVRRLKPDLLALLESARDVAAPAHRWRDAQPPAPDVVASAIAPDVCPDLSPDGAAALLAKYRRGGAVLTLETVNGGALALALAIELPASWAPERRERAFAFCERDGLAIYRALEIEAAGAIAQNERNEREKTAQKSPHR